MYILLFTPAYFDFTKDSTPIVDFTEKSDKLIYQVGVFITEKLIPLHKTYPFIKEWQCTPTLVTQGEEPYQTNLHGNLFVKTTEDQADFYVGCFNTIWLDTKMTFEELDINIYLGQDAVLKSIRKFFEPNYKPL
jgi:hypothetical protein